VKLPDLKWGVATRSTDDSVEYLHILKAPADGSSSLTLPPPADGKKFRKAVLLANKIPVALKQDDSGLHLKLPAGESWDKLDTVIALKVAADSPLQNLALWKAFRGSSFPDPTVAGGSAWSFAAVDGDPSTAWKSRPDGQTEGNAPQPSDHTPSGRIDLGHPARLSHIEVLGQVGMGGVVEVSLDPEFAGAAALPVQAGAPVPAIEIIKASYGIDGREVDVTAAVRERLLSGAAIRSENALAGTDPAPNQPKRLRLEVKSGDQTTVREFAESSITDLVTQPLVRIAIPNDTRARYLRIKSGGPLVICEIRAFGKFE
jgi:hypothetical protein